jgi:hypothetical protein
MAVSYRLFNLVRAAGHLFEIPPKDVAAIYLFKALEVCAKLYISHVSLELVSSQIRFKTLRHFYKMAKVSILQKKSSYRLAFHVSTKILFYETV